MSKVWGGGRGGWVVVGVATKGGAVVVVGVALEDMILVVYLINHSGVLNEESWLIAFRKWID